MKYKKYCKFSICIILILAICLCLGSCSSDVSDENDASNDSTDDSASDEHVCIYGEEPSLEFSSVEEFYNTVFCDKLSEEQKAVVNKFSKDDSGNIRLCDLNNLYVPILPSNTHISYISWSGRDYSFSIEVENGSIGWVDYCTYVREVYDRYLQEFDETLKTDGVSVSEQLYLDDGMGGTKIETYYTTSTSSMKNIRYSLTEGKRTIVIEKTFCFENKFGEFTSEDIPVSVKMYCTENDQYYITRFYTLTEDPTIEWLLEFGLTKYDAVSLEDASKIQEGMKYSEIADILGSEGTDVGYGAVIYRWILADGEYVDVHFVASELSENKTPEDLVASKITFSKND
ncbi:MAG: hypothetical protein E7626_06485 [Ruminococcaceae bacterium]|nr:hypothetical protein [Oscillospiraceae bacterium]